MTQELESLDAIKLRIATREIKALRKLLAAKDELLVAYRIGAHNRADMALSKIADAKQELEDLAQEA